MFHAYCIVHPQKSVRDREVARMIDKQAILDVDLWISTSPTVTIGEIRSLIKFLSLKPFTSAYKAAIVEADLLTLEAQQALLKTLEEPPAKSLLLLPVSNDDKLLSTIVSRCTIIRLIDIRTQLSTEQNDTAELFWKNLSLLSIGERLELATEVAKDRGQVELWLIEQISICHSLLRRSVFEESVHPRPLEYCLLIRQLNQTHYFVHNNISVKLALDHLFISFSHSFTTKKIS